jgi:Uma2 family endonuclease
LSAMPDWLEPGNAGRPFTVHDLDSMPNDGRRYELWDGGLIVTPALGTRHQKIVVRLSMLLEQSAPPGLETFVAPFAVRPNDSTEIQPDVLVARDEDLTETHLPMAPVLAVEVLSPSTALNDMNSKKALYERLGVPSYWVVDPVEVRLIAFELADNGRYELVVDVKDRDAFRAVRPFPVEIVPANLLGRLNRER